MKPITMIDIYYFFIVPKLPSYRPRFIVICHRFSSENQKIDKKLGIKIPKFQLRETHMRYLTWPRIFLKSPSHLFLPSYVQTTFLWSFSDKIFQEEGRFYYREKVLYSSAISLPYKGGSRHKEINTVESLIVVIKVYQQYI